MVRLITYWTQEVSLVMYQERKLLLVSFIIFLLSVFIGILSQCLDESFCRIILGDYYVDMTLDTSSRESRWLCMMAAMRWRCLWVLP